MACRRAAEHDAAIDPMDPQVERALDALPEAFRSAVMLVDIGELSYEEAATVMGCAVGTVRSRLSRARKVLFAALLPYAPGNRLRAAGGEGMSTPANHLGERLQDLADID